MCPAAVASGDARGRCQKPALFYAIDSHTPDLVRWLLEIGADVDRADQFGLTTLMHAAESADVACLDVLLAAGADLDRDVNGTALYRARDRDVVLRLPEDVFPPTDFHTATLLDDGIYVIGSLGCHGSRRHGTTPVFRLDLDNWRITDST